jgi:hypothetical protein
MSFIRRKRGTFKWPAKIEYPIDNGNFELCQFTAIFNTLSRSEYDELTNSGDDFAYMKRLLAGWEGMEEEDGTPIEFNEENLKAFIEDRYWILGIIKSYGATFEGAPKK